MIVSLRNISSLTSVVCEEQSRTVERVLEIEAALPDFLRLPKFPMGGRTESKDNPTVFAGF